VSFKIPPGWWLFPLHGTRNGHCTCGNPVCRSPGKHPAKGIKDFLKCAQPRDEAYAKWPGHKDNWGVIPGKSGFVGFDIDVKDGKQGRKSFERLQRDYGKLPDTMVIQTPSEGFHILFQRPDLENIPNSNGTIANGIDIRCDNGYLVAPGSVVFDKAYTIFKDFPIALLPDAWVPLLLPKEEKPIGEHVATRGNYSLPDVSQYDSPSEADFALAGRMKAAGQSYEQFCIEVGNLRRHDKKSHHRKYLQTTWDKASAPEQGDGEIDLIGFETVPTGQYVWLCNEWTIINPFGRKAFRFDGAIVCGEYQGTTLSLYIHVPATGATKASKLSKIWNIVGDGQPKFKAAHIIDRAYLVQVVDGKNGSLVSTIISPNPQWEAPLKPSNRTISPNPRPVPVKHNKGYKDSGLQEAKNG